MTTQNSDFYFPDFNVPALLSSLFTRFCMVSYLRPKLIFHDTFTTNRRQLSFTYHQFLIINKRIQSHHPDIQTLVSIGQSQSMKTFPV